MTPSKSEKVSWNGKEVRYRPGKLYICMKKDVYDKEYPSLIHHFCEKAIIRNVYQPGIVEVSVEPSLTLKVLDDMLKSGWFRFIELEREGYF